MILLITDVNSQGDESVEEREKGLIAEQGVLEDVRSLERNLSPGYRGNTFRVSRGFKRAVPHGGLPDITLVAHCMD